MDNVNDSLAAALNSLKESAMSGDSANMLRCADFMRGIEGIQSAWVSGGNLSETKAAATRMGGKPGRKSNAEKAAMAAAAAAAAAASGDVAVSTTDTVAEVAAGISEVTGEVLPEGQTEVAVSENEAPRRRRA